MSLKARAAEFEKLYREYRSTSHGHVDDALRDLLSRSARFKADVALGSAASRDRLSRPFYRLLATSASVFCKLGDVETDEIFFHKENHAFFENEQKHGVLFGIVNLFMGEDPEYRARSRALYREQERFRNSREKLLTRLEVCQDEWDQLIAARRQL